MEHENDFTTETTDSGGETAWDEIVEKKISGQEAMELATAEMAIMTELFEQRKIMFSPDDLTEDPGGGWRTFEEKVKKIFPEIPERHFKAIKFIAYFFPYGK